MKVRLGMGRSRCGICEKDDVPGNLHMAAEIKHLKAGTDPNEYLKQKTEEWLKYAKTPGYESLHATLCLGDLKTNEIFYRNKCWVKSKRDADGYEKRSESQDNNISRFKQNYCLRKTYHLVYDMLHEYPTELIELVMYFKSARIYVIKMNSYFMIQILLVLEKLFRK